MLGPRIAAALVDLAVLFVLSVVLGALKGEASGSDGIFSYHFSWYLKGAALALFLVLAFLYYFALEATIGRTVGKLLLGLQVVGPGQRRPSLWAVAVRTALRVVDWLPLLYLVGVVTTLATGAHRQRLGDLAAKTTVARARPIRRRGLVGALLAFCLVVAVGLSVVSGAVFGDSTYRAGGVSFDYPAAWQDVTGDVTYEGGGREIAVVGIGQYDLVMVGAAPLNRAVTPENLHLVGAELTARLRRQPGWTVEAGPEEATIGGMPSFSFVATGRADGNDIKSTFAFAFDAMTAYEINCQSTPEHAAEIEQGCEQIVRTFEVD